MNAPIAPEAVQTSELPLADITPSTTHIQELRRTRFKQAELQELADSIRSLGVIQAVVVRPRPAGVPYELVAGERRFLAAKLAGLAAIPATVRELTDEQVLEVQLVENLQRSDLHELEEAEGYDELMKLKGITAEDVAGMVGKSRAYVYARLKLLALDLDGRKAFYAGEIDASRALYVARIANPKLRERALKLATMKRYDGQFQFSARKLREELTGGKFSVDLRNAPFNLGDLTFFELVRIKKGQEEQRQLPSCEACPNRTGNCLDLFNQEDDPEICTEPACYGLKVKQHSARMRDAAEAAGEKVITGDAAKKIAPRKNELAGYVDLDATCSEDEFPEEEPDSGKFPDTEEGIAAWEAAMDAFVEREKGYKQRTFRQLLEGQNVQTVLLEDPKDKRIRTLAPYNDAAKAIKGAHGIALTRWRHQAQQHHSSPTPAESDEEKAKRLAQEEAQLKRQEEEGAWRRAVLKAIFEKWSGPLKQTDLAAIADQLLPDWSGHSIWGWLKDLYGKLPEPGQMKEPELVRLLAILTVLGDLTLHHAPKDLLALAKRLKINPDKIKQDLKAAARAKEQPAKAKPAKAAKKAKKS